MWILWVSVPIMRVLPSGLVVGSDAGGQELADSAARYIYWVPERRGHGRWTRYDFLALSLMIRGVLSPGSEALVDR
jgi:hypothetical protein